MKKKRLVPPTKRKLMGRGMLLLPIVAILLGWIGWVEYLGYASGAYITSDVSQIHDSPVGIVFGAGLRSGAPSPILKSRLDGAISLYRAKKVHKLLMSGDNRRVDYNEPMAMRKYALAHQVKSDDIVMDFAGRDTYDTCYRAKKIFGVNRAVLITQEYHLPRAIYLSRSMGIDATGYATPNLKGHGLLKANYIFREALADVKALIDLRVTHRVPYVDSRRS